jgi:hypothetical protein
VTALWAKAIVERTNDATFPRSHLFATPFSIPPGLFAKKWVLLHGPKAPGSDCISTIEFDYDAAKGRERIRLHFDRSGSEWQSAACGKSESSRNNRLILGTLGP